MQPLSGESLQRYISAKVEDGGHLVDIFWEKSMVKGVKVLNPIAPTDYFIQLHYMGLQVSEKNGQSCIYTVRPYTGIS